MINQPVKGKNIQPHRASEDTVVDTITVEKERFVFFKRIRRMMSRQGGKKGPNRQPSMPKSGSGAEQLAVTPKGASLKAPTDAPPNLSDTAKSPKNCQHYSNANNAIDCKGHRMGLLTGEEIQKYGVLTDRDDSACLQATTYDLRLGEGHMIYDSTAKAWPAIWVSTEPPPVGNPPLISKGTSLVIPRFGMALVQLREKVDLLSCIMNTEQPVMISGHFDLKLSRVKEGLISQQATQVEPGYQGKLFCYLFNQTGDDISISYTDINNAKIATIEFQYVSCISQCDASIRQQFLKSLSEEHKKYSPPYCNPHGIDDVRFFDGALPKHGGLSSIIQILNDSEKKAFDGCALAIKNAARSRTIAWSLIVALFVIILTLLPIILKDNMIGKLINLWDLSDTNRAELTSLTKEVNATKKALTALQIEAQKAYDMAKTELDELDIQKKELLLLEKSRNAEKPVISSEKTGKGGNQ